jgi:pimeloyl-ACP methyl ester carboxylesterase
MADNDTSTPAEPSAFSYVEVNGVRLAYQEFGVGKEPIVLVHGHMSDQRSWTAIQDKLATRFRVYKYSKRFAWPNEPLQDGDIQSWERDSEDLAALIETLDIGPVHLLTVSSGAHNALWLARTKPHLFRTLLLEEPPLVSLFLPLPPTTEAATAPPVPQMPPALLHVLSCLAPAKEHAQAGRDDLAIKTFADGYFGPDLMSRILGDPDRKRQFDDNSEWMAAYLRSAAAPPRYTLQDARNLPNTLPTLVITGAEGSRTSVHTDPALFKAIGSDKKRRVIVEQAGHLVHEDNPEQVFQEVVKFVFD